MVVVAERSLLAVECPDGTYLAFGACWGGTDEALAAVCAGTPPHALPDCRWTAVETARDFRSLVAEADFCTMELLYRVRGPEPTVFLPLWFGLPLASHQARATVGALVAVESPADTRAVRAWFRSLKGTVADALTAGTLLPPAAPFVLTAAVVGLTDRERFLSIYPGPAEHLSAGTGPPCL